MNEGETICDFDNLTMKPLSWFWCYIFVTHKLHFFFFLSPVLCNCLLCVPFCRGVGRREGEPDRDRANRKTETPASPQRALPLPAVRESTRDTHQVLYKDTHTHTHTHHRVPAVPMDGHLSSHEKTNAHFLSFTWCLFLPSLPIRGKCSVALLNETEAVLSYLDKEVSQRGKQLRYVIFYCCLPAADSLSRSSPALSNGRWQKLREITFIADQSAGYIFLNLSFGQNILA